MLTSLSRDTVWDVRSHVGRQSSQLPAHHLGKQVDRDERNPQHWNRECSNPLSQQVGIPASVFYNLSTLFIKASILSFYLRFAAANRPFQITVYVVLFVIVGYSLNAGFSFLYLCTPIRRLWDASVDGTCVDLYSAYLVSSVLNAVTDVVILLLPIWLLWPLRVRLKQKILVGLALMPGGLYVFLLTSPFRFSGF